MPLTDEKLSRKPRKFYDEKFEPSSWAAVEIELNLLLKEKISSTEELEDYIRKNSEFFTILKDENVRCYIKFTCNTNDDQYIKAYHKYFSEIMIQAEKSSFEMYKKIRNSEYFETLPEERYGHFKKIVAHVIEMFCEKNIELYNKELELTNRYSGISSSMTVNYKGQEYSVAQMVPFLKDSDRKVREESWRILFTEKLKYSDEMDEIFDELKNLRIQMAKNAGFNNYRDYMHQVKGRDYYTPEDCYSFHKAVRKKVLPFIKELKKERAEKLGVEKLRPWDLLIEPGGKVLRPFKDTEELADKVIKILHRLRPEFGIQLNKMKNTGFLDLDNRMGKRPGGYNTKIGEMGASFIFMNSIGLQKDVKTMVHEAGHAMHALASVDEDILAYRQTPHEVSELASMAMELITMKDWSDFYKDSDDFNTAVILQLQRTIDSFPWRMIVDEFQHWIYTQPDHTAAERREYFRELKGQYDVGIDWSGLEKELEISWMGQGHIFRTPFYYIEYAIAQLGAIAIYRNFKKNPEKAMAGYTAMLDLINTKPVPELYAAADIKFDFSEEYIGELAEFIWDCLKEETKKN
ncbi:M3 family oligoendopeptidase [bacterium]|nr:M3 family oligoendopeptidase [bacterium]